MNGIPDGNQAFIWYCLRPTFLNTARFNTVIHLQLHLKRILCVVAAFMDSFYIVTLNVQ